MVSRKVPVPRARGGGAGSAGRTVSRPGVSADGKSTFVSPYQPPPATVDFEGDISLLSGTGGYTLVHVGDYFWRVRVPGPDALRDLNTIATASGGEQIKAINGFLQRHLHPDDFPRLLDRLMSPDDTFDAEQYMSLYRQAVTVGTARPFRLSSVSPAPLSSAGALSEPNWLSAAYRHRSRH